MAALPESPQPEPESELRLLSEWKLEGERERRRSAAVGSVGLHIAAVVILAMLPKSVLSPPLKQVTKWSIMPLIAPPTQPEPNKGPISKSFDVESLLPRPRLQIPSAPPSTTRPAAIEPGEPAPPPPKIEVAELRPPVPQLEFRIPEATAPAPPPPPEKPKLAFETPAAASLGEVQPGSRIAVPKPSVEEALGTGRGPSGGIMVGDGVGGVGGVGEGLNLPPSPGQVKSNLELLSDPMGVDFRPYLIRILASVRRNWFAVLPESARLGRRGKVAIQFAIARSGSVPKLVIVGPSGADALDRAAVAGISASNPFPPLPPEFRGQQIRLQFVFLYNMPVN